MQIQSSGASVAVKPTRLASLRKLLRRDAALHIMLLLPVTITLIYQYFPLTGLIMAFQRYKPGRGYLGSEWVGWANFQTLFATSGFTQAVINTIIISVLKLSLLVIVPVIFSLLLNEMRSMLVKRGIQTIVYLPHFISWIIMSGILIQILSPTTGIVNVWLGYFGIEPIFFLGDNNWFVTTIVGSSIWKNFGFSTIVYLAALSSVDPNLLEAAKMDGAGHWKRMLHITLPTIVPTIILMATLNIGDILNAGFDQIFNLLTPVTMETGDIIDTLVYRYGISNAQYSLATAADIFKSTISAVLMIMSYRMAYKYSGYRLF